MGSLHTTSLLLPCDSLLQVLRAILLAVQCAWDEMFLSLIGCSVRPLDLHYDFVATPRMQTALGSDGRVKLSLDRGTRGGRIAEVAARDARDRFFLLRSYLSHASGAQIVGLSLPFFCNRSAWSLTTCLVK